MYLSTACRSHGSSLGHSSGSSSMLSRPLDCSSDHASFLSALTFGWCLGVLRTGLHRPLEHADMFELAPTSRTRYHGSRLGEVVEVQRGVKTVFFYVAGKPAVPRRAFEATVARISADLFPPAASFPPRTGHSSRSIK